MRRHSLIEDIPAGQQEGGTSVLGAPTTTCTHCRSGVAIETSPSAASWHGQGPPLGSEPGSVCAGAAASIRETLSWTAQRVGGLEARRRLLPAHTHQRRRPRGDTRMECPGHEGSVPSHGARAFPFSDCRSDFRAPDIGGKAQEMHASEERLRRPGAGAAVLAARPELLVPVLQRPANRPPAKVSSAARYAASWLLLRKRSCGWVRWRMPAMIATRARLLAKLNPS